MNNNGEDGDHRKDNAKFPFHIFILKYFILFISLIANGNKCIVHFTGTQHLLGKRSQTLVAIIAKPCENIDLSTALLAAGFFLFYIQIPQHSKYQLFLSWFSF